MRKSIDLGTLVLAAFLLSLPMTFSSASQATLKKAKSIPVGDLADFDEDGIFDTEELFRGTNPYNADTDGDGISDRNELALGTSPQHFNATLRLAPEKGFEGYYRLAVVRPETGEIEIAGHFSSTPQAAQSGGGPSDSATTAGGIYSPPVPKTKLPGPAAKPSGQRGQICVHETKTVGGGGGALFIQIVGGNCLAGDGICSSSGCAASVGSTYEIVDPLVLIGG